jgi:cysteine synthase
MSLCGWRELDDTATNSLFAARPFFKGIGIGRITANFKASKLDGALRCSDVEAINMCYYLLQHEGKCA